MNSRQMVMKLLVLSLLIFGTIVPVRPATAAWTDWVCFSTVSVPVTGGTMVGRACDSFWTGSELWWAVWADTDPPTSYRIYTYVAGYDKCGGGDWSFRMDGDLDYYNTGHGTSGSHTGTYQNCMSGHNYHEWGAHVREVTQGGAFESGAAYTITH